MPRTPLTFDQVAALARSAVAGTGVPLALVVAIARHESGGFFPDARRGEPHLGDSSHGLMQLLLSTARSAGYAGAPGAWNAATASGTGLYDPATNLRYGALHLAGLLRATGGDVERAVSAYNAGLGNAKKATVETRFCLIWKPTAPKTNRVLDRDCDRIRVVRPGEWMNQDYVDVVMRYKREAEARLLAAPLPVGPVGAGDVPRPAGASSASGALPLSSGQQAAAPVFVVRAGVAIAAAAIAVALWLLRRV